MPPSNPEHGGSSKVQVILALLLVAAVGIAVAVNHWAKKAESGRLLVSANEGAKPILPNAESLRTAEATLSGVTNRVPEAASAHTATAAPTPPSAPVTPPMTPSPPATPPKFPSLRLQSIFYRPANPSVMINGKTLFLDDEIQEVRVVDIQPASVTLVLSGYTNILTLR
jgi:hypothetical protein